MRVTVVVFPGSNCDHDVEHVYGKILGQTVSHVWHKDRDLENPDIVVLPGGFSYGDYLRTGALAKISPIMAEVSKFAASGGKVIGICNGFQILCECGLLPGALLQNLGMKFLSRFVHLRIERNDTPFTSKLEPGQRIFCPLAHGDGNYFADKETLDRLEGEGRVIFRYCDADGNSVDNDHDVNPNGSARAIAGICNEKRNVVGLMPHPERISEERVGGPGAASGLAVFESSLS